MNKRVTAPLEKWMDSIIDYRGKTPKKKTNGIPLVTAKVIKGGRINTPNEFIALEDYEEWMSRGIPKPGDVVITTEAPLGEVAQLPKEKVALAQRVITMRGKKDLVDNTYLKYLLLSRDFQYELHSRSTGTTVLGIKQSNLRQIDLTFPEIDIQKAVANTLGTLDKKIELNKKTNETLEGLAKALFKSWFLDFDPAKAKSEGCSTGLPDEISTLFPDSFEESELGKIPKGWKIHSLKELSSYISRGISPKYCDQGKGVSVINQKCIRNGIVDFTKARNHDPLLKKIDGREIQKFDCLINSTGMGTLGRVAITPEIKKETLIVDSHVTVVRGQNVEQSLFLTMLLLQKQKEIESLGEGSTGQTELSRKVLGDLQIIFPSEKLIHQFFISSLSLFEKKWLNEKTIVKLHELRDTLLPKLISGELRISDAENIIEESHK